MHNVKTSFMRTKDEATSMSLGDADEPEGVLVASRAPNEGVLVADGSKPPHLQKAADEPGPQDLARRRLCQAARSRCL